MRECVALPISGILVNPQLPDMVQELEGLGFTLTRELGEVMFMAYLPDGWRKLPTDHHMYFVVKDDKSRIRATIMQKITLRDADANFRLECRYQTEWKTSIADTDGHKWCYVAVVDCGKEIYKTSVVRDDDPLVKRRWLETTEDEKSLADIANAWLTAVYPDWKNPLAYWDGD